MEEEKKLHEKLVQIQSKLNVPKNQYNSFGKYKYRSCEDILEAVKPLLAEYNCVLNIYDEIVNIGDRFYVKAVAQVISSDGKITSQAYAREEEIKKGMDGSQVTGSSSSYARKYALNGLFCIDDTKDADTTNKHAESQNNDKHSLNLAKAITLLAKERFANADEYKAWRIDNALCEDLNKASSQDLNELHKKLKALKCK